MKKELNKKSDEVTVIVEVTIKVRSKMQKYIRDEQCPLFFNLNDDGIKKFEWFLNESDKTGTLIEIFENANVWEGFGNKILGSTINKRFTWNCLTLKNSQFFEI